MPKTMITESELPEQHVIRERDLTAKARRVAKFLAREPVRRGAIYCAPWCGGKCTWVEFQAATKAADALAKRLGDGWRPRVWENLGWHHGAVTGEQDRWSVFGSGRSWSCFAHPVRGPGGRWLGNGTTPSAAVKDAIALARADASAIADMLEDVGAVLIPRDTL